MTNIQFATQSYKHSALPLSAQRCINAYAEIQPRDTKSLTPVFGCPGITTFATVGEGPIRALFEMNNVAYAVSRDKFYSISSTGTPQLLGAGITSNSFVSIAGNGTGGNQIIIVNGSLGWVYNTSTQAFVQIGDADFHPANTVTFIDGYFVLDWANTNKFYVSELLNGVSYDALDFASAESNPDDVVAVWNRFGLLLLFGRQTIEAWDHTGAYAFPFQRFKGATLDRGLSSAYAIVSEDMGVFFLGDDRVFYRMQGLQLQRISTHAIEVEWETYTTVDDAFCFTVAYGGHKFIYITFPTEQTTWGYDIATGLWHERQSYDPAGNALKWRVSCSTRAYGKTLVGDANSNKVGKIDASTYTEFGDNVIMTLVSPPLHGDGDMVSMPALEIDIEAGVGIATGQGSDPQMMLDWSDDGGHIFEGPQLWRTMGAIGAYRTRAKWGACGSFIQRCLRLSISDPVKRTVIAARAPGLTVTK